MAPEAASIADEAALIADVAADEAASIAELADEAASPIDGVVMTVVVAGAAGIVVVVVVSSFLLQAAKEMAAARVTISSAVFIFLLGFWVRTIIGNRGNPLVQEPQHLKGTDRTSAPMPSH
ncbi:MAG: hypothetical protein ABIZ18_03925 [Caldimonas sp.]